MTLLPSISPTSEKSARSEKIGTSIRPFVVIALLLGVFFYRQIFRDEVFYCCDNLLINIPSKIFLVDELRHGRFPFWNPYIFSGTPFFSDINLSVLHPLNFLYGVFPPFRALTVTILSLFLAGSTGMYFLGRTLRLGAFASVLGAVVFGLCGSLIVYTNNISILQVAVLVPWVFAGWIRYGEKPTGKHLMEFVFIAVLQIISGHPQLTFYTWLLLIAYVFVYRTSIRVIAKAIFFVALVSSIQTIPFLMFAFESTRMSRNFVASTMGSLHPLSMVRFIVPGIVGDLSRGTAWIQGGTMHGYVGIIPLLLLPFALGSKIGRFCIACAFFSLIMAMGKYTPVYWVMYNIVPGIALFREPSQFLFFWSFGVAVCVMIAAEAFTKREVKSRYILVFGVVFLLIAGFLQTNQGGIFEQVRSFSPILPERIFAKINSLPLAQRQIIIEGLLYNLSFFGILSLFTSFAIGRLHKSGAARAVFVVVLFADLYVYGQMNVSTIAETAVRKWQDEQRIRIASWKLSTGENFRYYTDPALYPYPSKKPFGHYNDPGESEWQYKILRPTIGMMYGLYAVDGYSSMVLRSYQQVFGGSKIDPTGVVISSIVDPHLRTLGVRYILTKPNNPLLSETTRYRMLTNDGEIAVYEDKKAVSITLKR